MKRPFFLLVFFAYSLNAVGQADIHFSQFYETCINRNPALTGVFAGDYKFGVYYRNQWSSISNPYQTYLATAEIRFEVSKNSDDFLSCGLMVFTDKAGSLDQRITSAYPVVNYNKALNPDHHMYLSAGFTGGYIQYSFDPSKATFNNQYINGKFDPDYPSFENLPKPSMNFYDVGAGINFNTSFGADNTNTVVVGFSGYHFSHPDFSYYKLPGLQLNTRWNGNAAVSFDLGNSVTTYFHTNCAFQGTYSEIMAGILAFWSPSVHTVNPVFMCGAGAFYRLNDAIIPVVKIKYMNMSFGISYDVNVSTLKEASNMRGGLETTLFYTGLFPNNAKPEAKLVCPRF